MQNHRPIWAALLVVLAVSFFSAPAHAVNFVSWVSAGGNNANPCTRASPCQTFTGALLNTVANGEIRCLDALSDPGNSTIRQSITIDCRDVPVVVIGPCFDIQLPSSDTTQTVRLRGITCDAQGVSGFGIRIASVGQVFLDDMVIIGYGAQGVLDSRSSAGGGLFIKNSEISNNGSSGSGGGLYISPAGPTRVVIEGSRLANNSNGVFVNGTSASVLVEVKDSTITKSGSVGIFIYSTGSTASVILDHSSSTYNGGIGIYSYGSGAFASLSDSTVTGNVTGLAPVSGGSIGSYGNNRVNGNIADGASPTSIALK